jgi:L-seryl-tRNA(Ser) seleniumtransferase
MAQRAFGVVGGRGEKDWSKWGEWAGTGMLPRKDGVALPLQDPPAAAAPGEVDYASLGVHEIINARGAYTVLGGSLMLPEVVAAMQRAATSFVDLEELMEAVGRRLAVLHRCAFAIVTNGAAAAMCLATCAVIAGTDARKMELLPDTSAIPRREVIIQAAHRGEYDHAVRMAGGVWVVVRTLAELRAAISPRTAMLFALGVAEGLGEFSIAEMAAAGRERGVPLFVDAAAERPDVPDHYLGQGATLVAYSGGKGLRGPQASGVLLGSDPELLWTAFLNGAPHHGLGRPLKAGKEEIMGLLAACEQWAVRDHAAERAEVDRKLAVIEAAATGLPSLAVRPSTVLGLDGAPRAYISHRLRLEWDPAAAPPARVADMLLAGEPPIALIEVPTGLDICAHFLQPGEEVVLADRLRATLEVAVAETAAEAPVASSRL